MPVIAVGELKRRAPGQVRCPQAAQGLRRGAGQKKSGLWWVSVLVAKESVPEEVAKGGALCSVGSPPDVRRALKGSGRV
ncbi:MAG: hypothetical protein R6U22_10550 [Desulfohalobiaceae bacterium]